jgi:hypothetical protein
VALQGLSPLHLQPAQLPPALPPLPPGGHRAGRHEDRASHARLAGQCAPEGAPSPRTLGRWLHSFGEQSPRWLLAVQQTLAHHHSDSPLLDVLGPATGPRHLPAALLFAAGHLLAFAKTRWAELAHHRDGDRLRFLWHWGSARRLGRLV